MGYYGTEKNRQMARSILPSTARKKARDDKRALHQRNRAQIKAKLPRCGRAEAVVDEFEEGSDDLNHCWTPRDGWDSIVYERRGADKINHFEKWAEKVTADIRMEDKLTGIAKLLPEGVIGDHALTHLSFLDWRDRIDPVTGEFDTRGRRWWKWGGPFDTTLKDQIKEANRQLWKALADTARDDNARRKFNKALYNRAEPWVYRWTWDRDVDGNPFRKKIFPNSTENIPRLKGKDGAREFYDTITYRLPRYRWKAEDQELFKFTCRYFNIETPWITEESDR